VAYSSGEIVGPFPREAGGQPTHRVFGPNRNTYWLNYGVRSRTHHTWPAVSRLLTESHTGSRPGQGARRIILTGDPFRISPLRRGSAIRPRRLAGLRSRLVSVRAVSVSWSIPASGAASDSASACRCARSAELR
jgi:hypothetical protein